MLTLLAFAAAAEPFHIYTPSPRTEQIHVFAATEKGGELQLSEQAPIKLGFACNCIVAHPSKPILYVTASGGQEDAVPGATVYLKPDGSLDRLLKADMPHGYCHLNLDKTERFLLGVDYGGGHVDVLALNTDDSIGQAVSKLDEGRKAAHCVFPSPDNKYVYIPYVKDNLALYQYAFDAKTGTLTPLSPKDARPPQGTGPRHQQYHPTLPVTYFSNEQGYGVSVYDMNPDGQLKIRQVVPIAENPPTEHTSGSDLAISPDGRFLFSGVRGNKSNYNWVSSYKILPDGSVEHIGLAAADNTPWGLSVSPDGRYVLATAWVGETLTAYKVADNGSLSKAASLPLPIRVMDVVTR